MEGGEAVSGLGSTSKVILLVPKCTQHLDAVQMNFKC